MSMSLQITVADEAHLAEGQVFIRRTDTEHRKYVIVCDFHQSFQVKILAWYLPIVYASFQIVINVPFLMIYFYQLLCHLCS